MNILVIDGKGGGVGSQVIISLNAHIKNCSITAVGTNTTATAAMLKAGASKVATGENAVVVACRKTDIIIGPIGIVVADALLGEITPKMAIAVGQSSAKRILLPTSNCCDNIVAGAQDLSIASLIDSVIKIIKNKLI